MKMTTLAVIAVFAGHLAAAAPVEIHFAGDSTLHAFRGVVKECTAKQIVEPDGAPTMHIDVPVFSLDTDHDGRDKNMFKMFEADAASMIRGEANWRDVLDAAKTDVPLNMTIHNQTHAVNAQRIAGDENAIHLAFDISLARFGLEPPSVLGIIKVSDTVHVVVDIQREALAAWEQNRQPVTEIH